MTRMYSMMKVSHNTSRHENSMNSWPATADVGTERAIRREVVPHPLHSTRFFGTVIMGFGDEETIVEAPSRVKDGTVENILQHLVSKEVHKPQREFSVSWVIMQLHVKLLTHSSYRRDMRD